jgi:hypothetical protein
MFYKVLALVSNGVFQKVSQYMYQRNIDVANYSLGMNLQAMARLVLGAKGIKNPTPEQLSAETKKVSAQYEPVGKAWMKMSPQTLFVVAAGNDATDNDAIPTFPANVNIETSLIVAASHGYEKLAKFSNYGKQTVDVAAPGVAIMSSVPNKTHDKMMGMSGTSMAAPFVTGVAAKMKDLNPALSAAQLKKMIMATVDKKDWLKEKVLSGGVVNAQRAFFAAEKSKSMTADEAIALSHKTVPAVISTDLDSVSVTRSTKDLNTFAEKLIF